MALKPPSLNLDVRARASAVGARVRQAIAGAPRPVADVFRKVDAAGHFLDNAWQYRRELREATPGGPSPFTGNENDPFEPVGVITSGVRKGMKVPTDQYRSVHVLEPDEIARVEARFDFKADPGDLLVANVRLNGRWYVARVPPDCVQDLRLLYEDTMDQAQFGHDLVRFIMKPDKQVTLYPQLMDDASPVLTKGDFIFEGQGVMPEGKTLDLGLGAVEQSLIAYCFQPTENKLAAMVTRGKLHRVRQFEIPVAPEQKYEGLLSALVQGSKAGEGENFNLFHRSCFAPAFAIIDHIMHYDWLHTRLRPSLFGIGIPKLSAFELFKRGILGPGTHNELVRLGQDDIAKNLGYEEWTAKDRKHWKYTQGIDGP